MFDAGGNSLHQRGSLHPNPLEGVHAYAYEYVLYNAQCLWVAIWLLALLSSIRTDCWWLVGGDLCWAGADACYGHNTVKGQGKCCTGGDGTPGCMAPLDCCKFRNTGCAVPPPELAPAPAPLIPESTLLVAPAPAPINSETPAPAPINIETPAPAPLPLEGPAPAPIVLEAPSPAPAIVETPVPAPGPPTTQPVPAAVKDVFLTRTRVVKTAASAPAPAPALG